MGEEWSKDKQYEIMGERMKNKYMVYFEEGASVEDRKDVSDFLGYIKVLGDVVDWQIVRSTDRPFMDYDIGVIVKKDLPEDRRVMLWDAILGFNRVDSVKQPALEMAYDSTQAGTTVLSPTELGKRIADAYEHGSMVAERRVLDQWKQALKVQSHVLASYEVGYEKRLEQKGKLNDD